MQPTAKAIKSLTIASVKMYFRDFTAVFFSLIFPVIFLLVFGYISTQGNAEYSVAVFNQSNTTVAKTFDEQLKRFDSLKRDSEATDLAAAKDELKKGDIKYIIVIPEDFGKESSEGIQKSSIKTYFDQSNLAANQTIGAMIAQSLDAMNRQITQASDPPLAMDSEGVQTAGLKEIDYLLPGLIGFSIMSLGLFGVANGFVSLKSSGALRRLHVAPIKPSYFLVGQTITRMLVSLLSLGIMVGIGMALFDFHMRGSVWIFMGVATLGALLFQAFGFAIAGWAKNENQAAPLSNLVFFPMMFFSGTFFPRESLPDFLKPISEYLPLTYLSDALRQVANNAAGLADINHMLLGMFVWLAVSFFVSTRLFRWE